MTPDPQQLAGMQDLDRARGYYNEARQNNLTPEQAQAYARGKSMQDLAQIGLTQDQGHVVDSLQRIGGGGGVAMDPMTDIAKRQADLLEEIKGFVASLAGSGDGMPANEANIDDGGF